MSYSTNGMANGSLVADKCPGCGAPLPPLGPDGTTTCKYCGSVYRPPPPPTPVAPPAPTLMASTVLPSYYNPYAGGMVPPHAIYSQPVQRKRWPALLIFTFFLLFMILPMIFSFATMSGAPSYGGGPMTVSIQASPATSGPAPFTVYLSSTVTGGSSPFTYYWSLSDGTSSTQPGFSHTFLSGDYTVTLTVTDSNGDQGTANLYVYAT